MDDLNVPSWYENQMVRSWDRDCGVKAVDLSPAICEVFSPRAQPTPGRWEALGIGLDLRSLYSSPGHARSGEGGEAGIWQSDHSRSVVTQVPSGLSHFRAVAATLDVCCPRLPFFLQLPPFLCWFQDP